MTSDPIPSGLYGLGNNVLKTGGIVGLVLIMLLGFFIYAYWTSLQAMHQAHLNQTGILQDIKIEELEQTEILKDIRYSLRVSGGLTLRSTAR